MMRRNLTASASLVALMALMGCDDSPGAPLAPSATTLTDSKPKAAQAVSFQIETTGAKVDFTMDAPNEKIRGRADDATRGTIEVDPSDLSKTTAHLYVSIMGLELYQRPIGDDGTFQEEKKEPLQNEHARNWLEIGPCDDADDQAKCEKEKKLNENVELVLTKVEASPNDITAVKSGEAKVTATVTGKFLLHQHETEKSAKLELRFEMKDGAPVGLHVKTLEPFAVGLAEHDVRPRTTFGKLAKKSLDVLVSEDKKVAAEAEVSVAFAANLAQGDATK